VLISMPLFPGMLAHRSKDDIESFARIVAAAGYDPVAVAAIVENESAGTWSPAVRGPKAFKTPPGYPVGLLQFAPDTAKVLGTTTARLAAMSFVEQSALIPRYYALFGGPSRFRRPADYYAAGWGSGVGAPDDYVLAAEGDAKYAANAQLDHNKDGKITLGDLNWFVTSRVAQGSAAGFWQFDTNAVNYAGVRARFVQSHAIHAGEILLTLKWARL
jgi:hypothetical protein